MASNPFPPSLRDRFEHLGPLGKGATARVFRARDRELDREVALKLLADPKDPRRRERFLREASMLSKLKHENILQVYDFGISPDGPYLATEVLTGPSLDETGAAEDACAAMLGIARGLAAVHGAGLLHRDIKPENMRVRGDGTAVLLDFGLAFDPDRTPMTRPGKVVGTYGYLAPEVLGGYSPTPSSDWFSFGVSLFHLVEGRPPFSAEEVVATLGGQPMPVPTFETLPLDSPVRDLILRLLDKDPEKRPVELEEIEAALQPAVTASTVATPKVSSGEGRRPGARLRVALALLLGAGAGLLWIRVLPRPVPPTPAPSRAPVESSGLPEQPETTALRRARKDLERLLGEQVDRLMRPARRPERIARLTALYPILTHPLLPPKWRRYVEARLAWQQMLEKRRPSGFDDPAYPALREELAGLLPVRLLEDLDLLHEYALSGGAIAESFPLVTEGAEAGTRGELIRARWGEVNDGTRAALADLSVEPEASPEQLVFRGDLHYTDPLSPNLQVLEALLLRLEAGAHPLDAPMARTATRIFYASRRTEAHEALFICRFIARFGAVWMRIAERWGARPLDRAQALALAHGFGTLFRSLGSCSSYVEPKDREYFPALRYEVERALAHHPGPMAEVLERYRKDFELTNLIIPIEQVQTEIRAMELLCRKAARLAGGK